MIKRLFIACFVLCTAYTTIQAQEKIEGIKFFKGSFEDGLAEAKKQNKLLFVDFYAVWCGPCKRMSKNIFTQKQVGDYFNDKFVSIKLDAEKPENKPVAKRFKVEAFPTLGFFDSEGKAISINVGGLDASELIQTAKIAVGDVISFEKLYKMHKKEPDNMSIQQDLLRRAPNFISAQEGMNAEKWASRVERLYKEYINKKIGPDLINKQDYIIISLISGGNEKERSKMVEFMNANLDAWKKVAGDAPAYFIIEYNDALIEQLAKKGDEDYKIHLNKIQNEYKDAYKVTVKKGVTPYKKAKIYYDGLFSLYKNKDVEKYTSFIDNYLKLLGDNASSNDYAKAAQDLYYAAGDKLDNKMHQIAISWLEKALESKTIPIMDKINYLVMIGDSYRRMEDYEKAILYYNQGYVESLQMTSMVNVQQMMQAAIVRKLAEIDLLKE